MKICEFPFNDMSSYIDDAKKIINEHASENTRKTFDSCMRYWFSWLEVNGFSINTLEEDHIITFIMQHAEKMPEEIDRHLMKIGAKLRPGSHSISTIDKRIDMLSRYLHINGLPNPCRSRDLSDLMRKLREKNGAAKPWGAAMTLDVLNNIIATCDDTLIGLRDKALILFGFSTGGRRRSEIADTRMENLTKNADGTYLYNIGKSKMNQEGNQDIKPLLGRSAMAMTHWLKESEVEHGPIFRSIHKGNRISNNPYPAEYIHYMIRKRALMAGYDDGIFSAHSLRSGFVTEGARRGKPLGDLMQMTGHKTIGQIMQYYQAGAVVNNSAAYLAG